MQSLPSGKDSADYSLLRTLIVYFDSYPGTLLLEYFRCVRWHTLAATHQ
jgi:hypothetical protein